MIFASCGQSNKNRTLSLLKEWMGKEVRFPTNMVFTIQGKDTVEYQIQNTYKIVSYVDSIGCTSCKLNLSGWKHFMADIDSMSSQAAQFIFFLCPKKGMELYQALRVDQFKYPICIDLTDSFNKLNHFPSDMEYQTFLLDKDNKVLAIGNPVHNPKVKELYLKIIGGESIVTSNSKKKINTEAIFDKTSASLGSFDWRQEQKATFILKNLGDKPLFIEGVSTSCGCTTVDYPKEPAHPGKDLALTVTYKAEQPEHFNKTITVYCNVETSPVKLTISGDAE